MADASSVYLCYDLKGIQSFIFAVPRLKYICGGSATIDRFDREIVRNLDCPGCTRIFSGGGKGAFRCSSAQAANELKNRLIQIAHDVENGLSISFGVHSDYSEAACNADESYPYLPNELDGHPCITSGLYPVQQPGKEHELIRRRDWSRGDHRSRRVEKQLLENIDLPERFLAGTKGVAFFHNVDEKDKEDQDGSVGASVLGNRNRWAVIAMDGNDMGEQHRKAMEGFTGDTESHLQWLTAMSDALDDCSRDACAEAIQAVARKWLTDREAEEKPLRECIDSKGFLVLPLRPLLVGGDDILVLCHPRYADLFFVTAVSAFTRISQEKAAQFSSGPLWPATGNRLSISGGILYAPVGLPLSTAIPFAQQLEASAKRRGRSLPREANAPTPPCIDWESVTEGVLETPDIRRSRELVLQESLGTQADAPVQTFKLTQRPMSLEDFQTLRQDLCEAYAQIPGTIRHSILPGLRKSFWERKIFLARIGKQHPRLMRDLAEGKSPKQSIPDGSRWCLEEGVLSTDVVDALLLLEESARSETETIEE